MWQHWADATRDGPFDSPMGLLRPRDEGPCSERWDVLDFMRSSKYVFKSAAHAQDAARRIFRGLESWRRAAAVRDERRRRFERSRADAG